MDGIVGVDVTRLSSRGQIVIPQEMRKDYGVGEKLVVIHAGDQIILKRASDFSQNMLDDVEFAKRTVHALERYESGKFKKMSEDKFLAELEKW